MTQYQSAKCMQGMAVAPHSLAAESAVAVLREGGSAIEAMVAAAATIAVVYPHMNGLVDFYAGARAGGDSGLRVCGRKSEPRFLPPGRLSTHSRARAAGSQHRGWDGIRLGTGAGVG